MTTPICPKCQSTDHQIKAGYTPAGSQRYRCRACGCRYTPAPKESGYDEEVRLQALSLYFEGLSLREIGRLLNVNHQSIHNWIHAYANYLPADLPPEILDLAQLDGLFYPNLPRGRRVVEP
ncbi:MAG: IS1 family transposase [Anaerolineales bacterium]|nr:IS1 family transposase [Anaerolineales bacterium]